MYRTLTLFLCLLLFFLSSAPAKPIKDPIRTDSGLVSGFIAGEKGEILVYKGIPYAAPPVGRLRWRPPQPPKDWEGVLNAVKPCAWCVQPKSIVFSRAKSGSKSEDCLYLNVWTSAGDTGKKKPVMFWIHGGGHTTGSGGSLIYNGEKLARMGVVVVTINYRLGPFGYLAHPLLSKESERGRSGNYGLLDQIAALKWVQRNIAAFGGDPGNVTIFGESAGAASVTRLMVSPLASRLFHRAISQSGGPFGRNRHLRETRNNLESAEKTGERIAERLGCSKAGDVLAAMRAKSADEIMNASSASQGLFGKGIKFGPIVDGWAIPEDPGMMFIKGKMMDIPFMVGSNADEGTIFLKQLPVRDKNGYQKLLELIGKERSTELIKLFPVKTGKDIKQALNRLITVMSFAAPARVMARLASKRKSGVFVYHFTRVAPLPRVKRLGAFHAAEIFYAFGNIGRILERFETDRNLSEKMRAYWTNFAGTGNPNGSGLPQWPAYSKAGDQHLELGAEIRIGKGLYRKECDFFEERLFKAMKKSY